MKKSYVWSSLGLLLILIGFSMLIPAAAGFCYGEDQYRAFLKTAIGTIAVGGVAFALLRPRGRKSHATIRDSYAVVAYGWVVATLFCMLPYILGGITDTVTDAVFESMSGLTTVGATIFPRVEDLPRCVLLWRSVTHWLGGMGILVLFVAMLAGQGSGAMHIFKAKTAGSRNRLQPHLVETARNLWLVYMAFTAIMIVLYCVAGMGIFDAVNHGFSLVATGGFSTRTANIGAYHSPLIEWVTIFGMLLAGGNYSLYFYAARNRSLRCFAQSLECRAYLGLIAVATVIVMWFLAPAYQYNLLQTLRYAAFHVISVITTTGFHTADFEQWAVPARSVLILLMLSGACAGSTAGGIKIDRHVILMQKAVQEIRRFLHPRLVIRLKSGGKPVGDDVVLSVTMFFYTYLLVVAVAAYLLCMCGCEMLDAVTVSMSCLAGIGPGLGAWGPSETYAGASLIMKWIMILLMLLGRLEIYTALVIIRPFAGRKQSRKQEVRMDGVQDEGLFEPMVVEG